MSIKTYIQELNLRQVILSVFIGITCFIVWLFVPFFVAKQFSPPEGHPLVTILFVFLPGIFGISAGVISKGSNYQRTTYLFLGGATIFIVMLIVDFFNPLHDPIYDFLPLTIGLMAAIQYFIGGMLALLVDNFLDFIKRVKSHL